MKSSFSSETLKKTILNTIFLFAMFYVAGGQVNNRYSISGHLSDNHNGEPVIFATIAVSLAHDSTFLTGVSGDYEGNFRTGPLNSGNYMLRLSALGYLPVNIEVKLISDTVLENITMLQQIAVLEEVIVSGERIKARKESDRTVFYINEKINKVSASGTDLLAYIPGVKVDLMKNISVNGSTDLIIQVNGKERDMNYVSRLNPENIDRVEIIDSPGSGYDASLSGVINIVLRERSATGTDFNLALDIPVLKSMIYSHPSLSTSYNKGKLELFTSYTGSFSYFDITESGYRKIKSLSGETETEAAQIVRQKDWSHVFHLGIDFNPDNNNQLSFYAYANPFSSEFDGSANYRMKSSAGESGLNLLKDDSDKNLNTYYSVWYRHAFDKPGSEISVEMNFSNFRASNGTSFIYKGEGQENLVRYMTLTRPLQNSASIKLDCTMPFTQIFKLNAGIKSRIQDMKDRQPLGFIYVEDVTAGWLSGTLSLPKYTLIAGIRTENAGTGMRDSIRYHDFIVLPRITVTRKLTDRQSLELSYNSILNRPNIYELNPYYSRTDPFSSSIGNPGLKNEIIHKLGLTWSGSAGDSYLSAGIFYERESNSINRYAVITSSSEVESRIANLGTISRYGFRFSGPLRLNSNITITPWVRLFNIHSSANSIARANMSVSGHKAAIESGLSAIASFRHDFALSFQFQYNSPSIDIQSEYYSDPLWMITAEKTFLKNFRAGIVTALPFTGSFTYHGNKTVTDSFYSKAEGRLRLPVFPFWFRFSYRFNPTGKEHRKGSNEDIINIPSKGF